MSDALIDSLTAAVAARPGDVALRLHLAELLVAAGRGPEAIADAAHVLAADPAEEAARRVLAADPADGAARRVLAAALPGAAPAEPPS